MNILRAKTIDLIETTPLSEKRIQNSELNRKDAIDGEMVTKAFPRRFIFELTNMCNLDCIMCGRNATEFKPTIFDFNWVKKFELVADYAEEVTLMGWGEPTIHPQFSNFLYWAQEKGLRKYFCTNGMRLDSLFKDIFDSHTDVIAISLDGKDKETNDRIRKGADFEKIIKNIRAIADEKIKRGIQWPYMNFVFTAMKSNFYQIPEMVKLAKEAGVQEVKVVYLTVFDKAMLHESLYDCQEDVQKIFSKAEKIAKDLEISLKLPHIQGMDEAGYKEHKDCFVPWRDFFLGSDGYTRTCMSTSKKLFHVSQFENITDVWNKEEQQLMRKYTNDSKNMDKNCRDCYQSSFANWNKKMSFIQIGNEFSPVWER